MAQLKIEVNKMKDIKYHKYKNEASFHCRHTNESERKRQRDRTKRPICARDLQEPKNSVR